ncbi:GLPGLI family protein [Pedobacter gandavensis]|uniref:GLPGLI family protein n=1 Tax=Pedobacter gandavensis TaxID=2679963 RepID=A0ABR6ESP1_9SPHI|nr:GLPGLI family protein [Pedobacter gandavensis]MBB2148277.1 GLPGLI family protein [Pedobacter gandavensis]
MKIVFALFLSLSTFQGFAQKGEPVILNVIYKFKHINDLNKPNKPFEQEMILRLGKTESRYNSWTDEVNMKTAVKNANNSGKSSSSSGGVFGFVPTVFVKSKGVQDFDLLQYPGLDRLVRVVVMGDSNYLIETSLPVIDWKVSEEKKEIGGYTCQKATGTYAGRTYIAWFAPKLPFRCGPWKLSGLPGLILEAKDLTNEVSFTFKELSRPEGIESTAPRKSRVIKVSEKAFDRAYTAFEKDPVSVYQSQLPIGADKAQLAYVDDKGVPFYAEEGKKMYESLKTDLKKRKSNPLELKIDAKGTGQVIK